MFKNILSFIGVCVLLLIAFLVGSNSANTYTFTKVLRDTVIVEKPVPYETVKVRTEYVYVPVKDDAAIEEDNIQKTDSVLTSVAIERRVYQDSLYRAVVSGAVVGDIHPTMESIELYTRNETNIVNSKKAIFEPYIRGSISKSSVGFGVGVNVKDQIGVDVQYMRMGNRNMVVFGANYRFNIKSK